MDSQQPLDTAQLDHFRHEGYLVLPDFIDPGFNQRLKDEVDIMMAHRDAGDMRMVVSYREMGMLTSYPPAMAILAHLMDGDRFAMHHIHSVRFAAGAGGVGWHQDYEQHPHSNRSHLMVHIFCYLNGLNGEVGDLLVLPRSHNVIAERNLTFLGTADLEGSLCFDDLSPGSAVIVHSALWHARRPKPGGEGRPRYFIDISYCQNGVKWPAYGNVEGINAMALEMGLDRDGRYRFVYDSSQFYDLRALMDRFERVNQGSLINRLELPG